MRRATILALALALLPALAAAQTEPPIRYTPGPPTAIAGNAATATALAANGANCSAGSFPLGVDASGASESCGSSLAGNASTSTALAANGANCAAGLFPLGVDAAGAAEGCTSTLTNPSLGAGYMSTTKTAGSTGTTAGLLVKIDTSGNVVDLTASDTTGALGVAISTRTSGQALEVATRGIVNCVADNTTVIGNILVVGTSTGGRCRDSGQTTTRAVSSQLQVIGKALTVATVGNAVSAQLYGPGHYGGLLTPGVQTITPSGTTYTINWTQGAYAVLTLQTGSTIVFSADPPAGAAVFLQLIQPSGSDGTVTSWPAPVHWPGAGTPTLTTTDGQWDAVACRLSPTATYICDASLNVSP